jgi:hypothetical protein
VTGWHSSNEMSRVVTGDAVRSSPTVVERTVYIGADDSSGDDGLGPSPGPETVLAGLGNTTCPLRRRLRGADGTPTDG